MEQSEREEVASDLEQVATELKYAAERLRGGEDSIADIILDVGDEGETASRIIEYLRGSDEGEDA